MSKAASETERLQPWYFSDPAVGHPFDLEAKETSDDPECTTTFQAVSCFPWDLASAHKVWNGVLTEDPEKLARWRRIIDKWSGVVAAGGGRKLRFVLTRPHQQCLPLFSIEVPDEGSNIKCIAWCMVFNADEILPLVAFSGNSILYVFNVEGGVFHGVMKGHGGKINALAVHPRDPSYLLSTSHDHTCRIYDLTQRVDCEVVNPCWPGTDKMSLAGPAFGLRANGGEGTGFGRCVAVLAGGPSGGHLAPVLGAEFHPLYPIIATCGMDHAVKLWRIPDLTGEIISREDKPLFSSTHIHSAQALSVTWMSQDILLSSSGPVIMRNDATRELYRLPGTLVLWRWLGFDRFFPLGSETWPTVLRGCASDYQESSSYKVIAEYQLPLPIEPARTSVFQSDAHTPLIVIPSHGCVRLSSVHHFRPRKPPPFPSADDQLSTATRALHLSAEETDASDKDVLPCWVVETDEGTLSGAVDETELASYDLPKLEACAIGEGGRLLIGVGEKEGIWIWRIPPNKQLRRGQSSSTS